MSDAPHLPMGDGREFDAIRAMLDVWGSLARGIGDDAAVLDVPSGERLVVSTDASVENVHFRREWLSAEEIGRRAAVAALSDLAAMAARPIGMLLALGVSDDWRGSMPAIARGVGAAAEATGCPIVGGNVSRARELSLTITVLGSAVRPLARSGVQPGDVICVTGLLGGPGAAVRAWTAGATPKPAHRARFVAPVARLEEGRWLAEAGCHAAIDISDGLVADAGHLAMASGVRLGIDLARIPCVEGVTVEEASVSGEEYELLAAFPADAVPDRSEFERRFGVPLTPIAVASAGAGVAIHGVSRVDQPRGHDHFS